MGVSTDDFRNELAKRLQRAMDDGEPFLIVNASELHKSLGAFQAHVSCCNAMKSFFRLESGDQILETTPSGYGGRVTYLYKLPKELSTTASAKPKYIIKDKTKGLRRENVDDLIATFETSLEHFHRSRIFTGPCVYFHDKTITIRLSHPTAVAALSDDSFFDAMYATLTSWGMHRLGHGGAKLRDISEIRQSFSELASKTDDLEGLSLPYLETGECTRVGKLLWGIIDNLKVGATGPKLVAGSKALHHLLPALCPPIDRNYTLRFFYGRPQVTGSEEAIFEEIFPELHRIASSCKDIIAERLRLRCGMNSSETKIVDNAIMGWVKRKYGVKEEPF